MIYIKYRFARSIHRLFFLCPCTITNVRFLIGNVGKCVRGNLRIKRMCCARGIVYQTNMYWSVYRCVQMCLGFSLWICIHTLNCICVCVMVLCSVHNTNKYNNRRNLCSESLTIDKVIESLQMIGTKKKNCSALWISSKISIKSHKFQD